MISSRWPLPMGTMESIALIPVCRGWLTPCLSQIPGAGLSIALYSLVTTGPAPSIGCPRAFTTRPIIASPTGTDTTFPVRFTVCPSPIPESSPNKTIETLFSSRFCAIPKLPSSNSRSSPAIQLIRPLALAIPSPTIRTVPVSFCLIALS